MQQRVKASPAPVENEQSVQNVRKALARQHVQDISEYTKQIHAKDREITDIKKKMAKVRVIRVILVVTPL